MAGQFVPPYETGGVVHTRSMSCCPADMWTAGGIVRAPATTSVLSTSRRKLTLPFIDRVAAFLAVDLSSGERASRVACTFAYMKATIM